MTAVSAGTGGAGPHPVGELMRPERLSALQPTRLSATRSLVNKMMRQGWEIALTHSTLNDRGCGEALYHIHAGGHDFHFVAFSYEPEISGRTPRIIGTHWDMMGALVEGEPTETALEQTRRELPKLYAGRAAPGTLIWCRSNRSLRAFDYIVSCLADGVQPDAAVLGRVCYLMRNVGLDGNGTFGTRSFLAYGADHPLRVPYHAQMLAAYIMREFSVDLAEHLARARRADAPALDPRIKRFLGLGNSSGLGLVLWINNHPRLVDRWLDLRERALAQAKRRPLVAGSAEVERLVALLTRCVQHREEDQVAYSTFTDSATVADDLRRILRALDARTAEQRGETFQALCDAVEPGVCPEAFETLAAMLIELFPEDADALLDDLVVSEVLTRAPGMTTGELLEILEGDYDWAFESSFLHESARPYVWYKSENAEEPRRGPHDEAPPAFNLALDLPGDVRRLATLLRDDDRPETVAEFLLRHPAQRACVERVQALRGRPYHSPHMDMLAESFVPAHLIRLINVAFYGLDKTKDYQQRLLRGVMFHGAPTRHDLGDPAHADWFSPVEPRP
jgi:hypothetical protein